MGNLKAESEATGLTQLPEAVQYSTCEPDQGRWTDKIEPKHFSCM